MQFQCSKCQKIIDVEKDRLGQAVACGSCKSVFAVPYNQTDNGAVIGSDFVIQKELGTGGMGKVYLAHQISLDRQVALKILNEEYAKDAKFVDDFLREARAAASLNHPNIVQAYAVGESDGLFYFAMEYLEGENLKDILEREGTLPQQKVLGIVQDVARALNFAWSNQRLVHRDIKPENIIITKDQVVKLSDLGLARYGVESGRKEKGEMVYGTPQYISPEQYLNMQVDVRSDLYSLGATAWHLLTGRPAYEAANAADIATKHLNSRLPRLYQVASNVNRQTSTLISIMMAKRPELRYKDAAEFLKDIAQVIDGNMPSHELSSLAQVPVLLDSANPLAVSSIPEDIVSLRTPIEITKQDVVLSEEEMQARDEVKPLVQRPPQKHFNPIPWMVGGIIVLLIAAVSTFFYLDSTKELRELKSKNPGYPEESHEVFINIRNRVNRGDADRIKLVVNFVKKYPRCTRYCADLRKMVEADVLAEIEKRRAKPFREELAQLRTKWEANLAKAHNDIGTKIAEKGESEVKAAQASVSAENKEEIEGNQKNEVERLKLDARSRITNLCRNDRKDRYNVAKQEQAILTLLGRDLYGSKVWAESYLNVVERAKQLSEMLKSGRPGNLEKEGALEMTDSSIRRNYYGRFIRERVPAYAYPSNYDANNQYNLCIDNYSEKEVNLGYYQTDVKDGRSVLTRSGVCTIKYRLLPLEMERDVYDVIIANLNTGLSANQLKVVRCAYLFVRGEDLEKVIEDLTVLSEKGNLGGDWKQDVDFMLSELQGGVIGQLKDAAWCADMQELEAVVARGNQAEIELYEKAMNRRYIDRLSTDDESRSDLESVLGKNGFDYEKYRQKWNEERENLAQ